MEQGHNYEVRFDFGNRVDVLEILEVLDCRDNIGYGTVRRLIPAKGCKVADRAEQNSREDIRGDYLLRDGKKYTVCDPTYIVAPIGATMPRIDNQTAKVIAL